MSDGDVGVGQTIGVAVAGVMEQGESDVVEMDVDTAPGAGELGAAVPVAGVPIVVKAAGIMEQGEERNNFGIGTGFGGEVLAVLQNTCPVADAVDTVGIEAVGRQDFRDDGREVVGECMHGLPLRALSFTEKAVFTEGNEGKGLITSIVVSGVGQNMSRLLFGFWRDWGGFTKGDILIDDTLFFGVEFF